MLEFIKRLKNSYLQRAEAQLGTIRQDLIELLKEETLDAKEISGILSIREKEVYDHLEHIARTTSTEGHHRLIINPCRCLACGYRFEERRRLTRPGKCPKCRNTRITLPSYHIE